MSYPKTRLMKKQMNYDEMKNEFDSQIEENIFKIDDELKEESPIQSEKKNK